MKKLVYSAAVLTEAAREKLLRYVKPELTPGELYPHVVAHHCTTQFKPTELPERFGELVMLRVLATASDDKCLAAVVAGVNSANYVPHITIAHMDEVKPVYSNTMLRAVPWDPMTEILELEARIGVFADGKIHYYLEELS